MECRYSMARYQLQLKQNEVLDKVNVIRINDVDHPDEWAIYQNWLLTNTPDPLFENQEEEDNHYAAKKRNRIKSEEQQLKIDYGLFQMLMEIYRVGVANGVWSINDFDPAIRQKAQNWRQILDNIEAIEGE